MKQISEGSSKESKQALVEKNVLVAEEKWTRQERIARERVNELYAPFNEAKKAKRWDDERECFLDPQGNPIVDPKKVDFDALVTEMMKKKEEETIDENVEKMIEKLKMTTEEAMKSEKTEINTQTESSESSNKNESMGNDDEFGK
ncbi:hypothetical protein Hanom_Chr10g00919641 [Helianthus anomalus]